MLEDDKILEFITWLFIQNLVALCCA